MNRIVTGYDEDGNPAIIHKGDPPTVIHAGRYRTTELWASDGTPPTVTSSDTSTRPWELEPGPGGACFRIVEIAPGDSADGDAVADDGDLTGELDEQAEGFQEAHATQTLDYVAVLSGEVTLVVADTEVTLGPGDCVVQQPGVPHDWQNRTSERVVMAGVLISAR
ncbi:MAG: cupin domain-containing protein [Nocardiopsaceae bacterium]|nr:cupin domain-containing protein [Nocardiopsaceae bacterium]